MKLITQAIQNSISLAYISLLKNHADLLTSPLTFSLGEIDQDLNNMLKDMEDIFISLDDLLGSQEESRSDYTKKLQSYHQLLEKKYKTLNGYSRELNHVAISLEEKYHIKTTSPESVGGIDYHQFIHEALDFIAQSETSKEKTYKIQEIIRCIPMRLTRDSYVDYISKSLQKVTPGKGNSSDTLFLSIFQQLFDGRLTPDYGDTFPDFATAIESIRTQSLTDLTAEDIEIIFDDIYLLKDTIEELHHILVLLHMSVSNMLILLLLDHVDFDLLCQEHITFRDFFLALKSLIHQDSQAEDDLILLETLPARLDDVAHELHENYQQSLDQLNEAADQLPQTQDTLQSIRLFGLIRFYLLLDIQDAFSFNEKTHHDPPLAQETIDKALVFLQDQLRILKPHDRKLRMQYLMSMLPFIMDDQEFAIYFNDGLEGTSNDIKKAHILAKVTHFMESCGFFENEQPQ